MTGEIAEITFADGETCYLVPKSVEEWPGEKSLKFTGLVDSIRADAHMVAINFRFRDTNQPAVLWRTYQEAGILYAEIKFHPDFPVLLAG